MDLSIRLLEPPLTSPEASRPDRIAQCAKLSFQLQNVAEAFLDLLPFVTSRCDRCGAYSEFPRKMKKPAATCPKCQSDVTLHPPRSAAAWLPWTEVNLALKELQIDHSYDQAFQRLEAPALESCVPARSLARIARFLAGSSKFPGEENIVCASVDALAYALHAVAGQVEIAGPGKNLQAGMHAALADPALREFPPLIAAGENRTHLERLQGGEKSVGEDTLRYAVPEYAPLWAVWLFSRLVQALCTSADFEANLRRIPLAGPAVAWFMEVWCYNYGKLHGELPAVASSAEALLNRSLPPSPLRTARLQNYRQAFLPADFAPSKDAFAELGTICGEHCRREIALELDIARSRSKLANGEPAAAASQLLKLLESLNSIGFLAKFWWFPLLTYWLGVAQAHQNDSQAPGNFQTLLDGPCASAARGQLALLALQNGFLDEAARWLDGARKHAPCVCYADALLLARRGRLSEARQRLESPEAIRCFTGSTYALPAQRLIAAMEERGGNREESERLHTAILASHPGDAIAWIRLQRILIESAFSYFRATGTPLKRETSFPREVPDTAGAAKTAWWMPYALLEDLMNASDDALSKLEATVGAQFGAGLGSIVWRRVLANQLLRINDAERALSALDIRPAPADSPRWFTQAHLVLTAWHWLRRVSQDGTRAVAQEELKECSLALIPLAQDRRDSPAAMWSSIVDLALQVESTGSLDALIREPLPPEIHAFRDLSQLWSEAPQQRRLAAEALLSALDQDGTRWNKEQKLLLQSVAAWTAEKDEIYVEQYSNLEPVLNALPVRGRDLWVPAALIRFSKSDWQGLAGDGLPDCIADMSDPLVCLIVELADARAAAGDLKKPSQTVATRIKGIHNNLAALVERLDSQRFGNGS